MIDLSKPIDVAKIDEAFGFPVPLSYIRLLELAQHIKPQNPAYAFDDICLMSLDAAGQFNANGEPYIVIITPPELYQFASTGTDGAVRGFVISDLPTDRQEHTIAEYTYAGYALLFATSIRGCLLRSLADHTAGWGAPAYTQIALDWFDISPAEFEEAVMFSHTYSEKSVIPRPHPKHEFVRTLNDVGFHVPSDSIDMEFAMSISWQDLSDRDPVTRQRRRVDWRPFTRMARARLARGEPGTALFIAENTLFMLNSNCDPEDRLACMEDIYEVKREAYLALKRPHLAKRSDRQLIEMFKPIERPKGPPPPNPFLMNRPPQ